MPLLGHHHGVEPVSASEHVDRDQASRVAFVRGWLAGAVAFVVVFVAVRWVMRHVWPDHGDLSDVGVDLLRVGTSLALAAVAGLAVGLVTFGRRT
jgi:hypothetical protein